MIVCLSRKEGWHTAIVDDQGWFLSKRSGLCLAINHSACDKYQWLLYEKLRLGQQDLGTSNVVVSGYEGC